MAGKRTSKKRKKQGDLGEYRRKRSFDRTPEPSGGAAGPSASGRLFVVQKHAARNLHYDLRLEMDGVLRSWAVPRGPSLDPTQKVLAVLVEDHPLEYGSFEGAIPAGEYGGGTVMLWDRGEWEPIGDPADGFERGDLKFRLHGEKLRGAWVLARMTGKAGGDGKNWLLIKKRDGEARPIDEYNVLGEAARSVLSGRSIEEIAADPEAVWTGGEARPTDSAGAGAAAGAAGAKRPPSRRRRRGGGEAQETETAGPLAGAGDLPGARTRPLPETMRPQLATPAKRAPDGDGWLHEIKLDGYRLIARLDRGAVRLITRGGHDWTERFPSVARALERLPAGAALLDGEVVVLDADGVSDFQALQNAFRSRSGGGGFVYFLFDLLHAERWDLTRVPLIDRKEMLRRLLEAAPDAAPTVQFSDHIVGRGPIVFEHAAESGLEGIISKRVDAPYVPRRSESWLKVKSTLREEFVVGGLTDPAGSRTGFGALLIGRHDTRGRLVYCGRVGTGFDERTLVLLAEMLGARRRKEPPFHDADRDPDHRTARWVTPDLVVEVEFGAWTGDGLVRHAVFRGVREDKDPAEVVGGSPRTARGGRKAPRAAPAAPDPAETGSADTAPSTVVRAPRSPADALVEGVRISHPKRTVYPEAGVTKREVAEHYVRVAPWMLPHVARRPLSLVRCPLGLAGESFYQRERGEGFPDAVRGLDIADDHAVAIDDLEGLLSLVQMGVLEIHAWGCREDDAERPDRLVFDLDPGPGIEWPHVVESARFVRDCLEHVGLTTFVKTTGGAGVHLVAPIARRTVWKDAKAFARAVAAAIVRLAPLNFVDTITKVMRQDRIFVDYLRNQPGATAVAAWSTRARPGATVSTPLAWEELSPDAPPSMFTVRTMPDRLAAGTHPWEGFEDVRQSITAGMRKRVEGLRG